MSSIFNSYKQTFLDAFKYAGRATRREYWIFTIINYIVLFVLGCICAVLATVFGSSAPIGILILAIVIIIFPTISLLVRRLHDVGLSGFWIWYLNPVGLPVIFVVHLLGLDKSVDYIIERIKNIGSVWLGWLLTFLFWTGGATTAIILLSLYAGKKEDNEYGVNPYKD